MSAVLQTCEKCAMNQILAGFCDGGVMGSNPSKLGGTWAWCHIGAGNERIATKSGMIKTIPGKRDEITNNEMELAAMIYLLQSFPERWSGQVFTDSRLTVLRIKAVQNGRSTREISMKSIVLIKAALDRLSTVEVYWLPGHSREPFPFLVYGLGTVDVNPHNRWCHQACDDAKTAQTVYR